MKRINARNAIFLILAAPILMTGATVWEGAVDSGRAGNISGEVYSIASNAFPKNSVVDITNLENGRTVRALVVEGLDASGILATLSDATALHLGLGPAAVARARMTLAQDSFPQIARGPLPQASGAGDSTAGLARGAEITFASNEFEGWPSVAAAPDPPAQPAPVVQPPIPVAQPAPTVQPPAPAVQPPIPVAQPAPVVQPPAPAVQQPTPVAQPAPVVQPPAPAVQQPIPVAQPAPTVQPPAPVAQPASIVQPTQSPLLGAARDLESGAWFVQVGAFSDPLNALDTINAMEADSYPVLVQATGSLENPLYRVLLGPMNQGESAAVLRRVQSMGNTAAFAKRAD
ncbi:MAG: SPOR domain-containing protein [Treponema sp.]|nr:SPOR domain-containing protein [Treponema sp.]